MTGHTPGPWRFGQYTEGNGAVTLWAVTDQYGALLASDISAEQDARLIAAAPDLLQVLEGFRLVADAWRKGSAMQGDEDAKARAEQLFACIDTVVAKATGKEAGA